MKKIILVLITIANLFMVGCSSNNDPYTSYDRRGRYQTMQDINSHLLGNEKVSLPQLEEMLHRANVIRDHYKDIYGDKFKDTGVYYQYQRFEYNYRIVKKMRLEGK